MIRYLLVSSRGNREEIRCELWAAVQRELDMFVQRYGPIDLMYCLP